MKFTVYWWIRADGRQKQGHDVIDSDFEDFDTDDAESMIQHDLDEMRNRATTHTEDKKLPNFCAMHLKLSLASRHSEISNWGVRKVVPAKS